MSDIEKARKNLRCRVQKARKLNYTPLNGKPGHAFTRGTNIVKYHVVLGKTPKIKVSVGDKVIEAHHFVCRCKEDEIIDCKGNSNGTICYHCLGWVKEALAKSGLQISFYADVLDALNGLNFGGELVKIQSAQNDKGIIWGVLRRKIIG